MKDGHRPNNIFQNSIKYLDYFGHDGFVESDS